MKNKQPIRKTKFKKRQNENEKEKEFNRRSKKQKLNKNNHKEKEKEEKTKILTKKQSEIDQNNLNDEQTKNIYKETKRNRLE